MLLAQNRHKNSQNQRNRVFIQITDYDEVFSQKPGFWPRITIKETGFFEVFRLCNDIFVKNPVSGLPPKMSQT
jgi:hypothetical protein